MYMIDFNAFSHGQIHSKLWLCEQIEPLLPDNPNILVLGAWYSLVNFMLLTRNRHRYNLITSVDKDPKAIEVSEKILNAWTIGDRSIVKTQVRDTDTPDNVDNIYDVIINCSCEHMNNLWFTRVKNHQLICIQTSNMVTDDPLWDIKNPNPTMEVFKAKYPMSQILFEGEKVFDYGHLNYSRYMLIGRL